MQNIADGLTQSVASDGQTPMSGALNMATNKINNLGTPTVSTDAVTKAYADALVDGTASGSFTNLAYTGTFTGGTGIVNLGSGQFYKTSGGNVGIGTVSPANKLQVISADNIQATGIGSFYSNNGTAALLLGFDRITGTNSTPANASLDLGTGSNPQSMHIDSSGNVLIGITSATSGGGVLQVSNGITFPAIQSASSNANTLDDYEEGTWTPVITAASGSITTYTSAGTYTKIGNLVVAQYQYGITNNGTGATAIVLNGLPFAGTTNTSGGLAREIAVTGVSGGAYLSGTTTLLIVTAAGAYMGATGWQVVGTISYKV
jgi:hypothetical protein